MIRQPRLLKQHLQEERGAVMLTALFFLFCLGSLLSLLLLLEQAALMEMQVQHTADVVTKGSRAAGKWEYVDEQGEKRQRLFATTQEAERYEATIIRGAREEADILWGLNSPSLEKGAGYAGAVHQKGEKASLYAQGIYYLRVEVKREIPLFWDLFSVKLDRVSQSGVYD